MGNKKSSRREFLRAAGLTGVGLVAAACSPSVTPPGAITGPTSAPAATQSVVRTASATLTVGPHYGGVLRLADAQDGVSLGYPPKMVNFLYNNRQGAPALETLLRIDNTGKPIPWLAAEVTTDVSAKTVTLGLRKGVKFHDGTDFNAATVKWNLEQYMSAKTPGTEGLGSIEAVNDSTVRINLIKWDSTITTNLAQAIGVIISPEAYKKNGADWATKNPVGTGPFQFITWEKDVRTVFKKWDGYWQKGKPYLDRIEWSPITDTLTRELSLRKGELDVELTVAAKGLAELEKDGYIVTRRNIASGAMSLVPDSANPNSPWANLKVRQAAQHAIDTSALVKSIFYGEAEPATQYGYKGHWGFNSSVIGYPYNLAKAKQLLADAGYPNGFKTKLLYVTTPQADQVFTAVQGYLKAVGIDLELDPAQSGRYNPVAYGGGKWDGLLRGTASPNPDVAAVLNSWYAGNGSYASMLVPDDYAKAIQNAITAPNFETKQQAVQEAMKLMIDKYALQITLYSQLDFVVSQPYVRNHGFMTAAHTALWTPEEASMEVR